MSDTGTPPRSGLNGFQAALLALLAGGVAIGFAPIFIRFADVGPLATGGYRLAVAVVSSCALLLATRPGAAAIRPGRADLAFGALAGLFFAGDLAFYMNALAITSVSHATLLINLAPVFAVLGSWFLLKERPSGGTIRGMTIALAGAALLALAGRGSGVVSLEGDLLALGGATFYAAYLIAMKRARSSVSPQALLLVSGTTGALALLPMSLVMGETVIPATLAGVLAILALGTIAHSLGHGLISQSLSILPVGYASVVLLIQPTVATIAAWIIFNEHLGVLELIGAAVTLTGIFVASRRGA